MARFIDPRVDWAFKRIFGSEDTKECLITFLNGLFEDELVIKDVTFAKTEKLGLRPDDRGVVFDVYCVTNEGKHVIVEMQKKEQEYFADRALYYTARAIVQQGVRGIWDYHLAPVYTVCFMDFVSDSPMLKEFRTDLVLTDLQTRQRVSDRMRIVYLQLPLLRICGQGQKPRLRRVLSLITFYFYMCICCSLHSLICLLARTDALISHHIGYTSSALHFPVYSSA